MRKCACLLPLAAVSTLSMSASVVLADGPTFNWTGFYLGGSAGLASSHVTTDDSAPYAYWDYYSSGQPIEQKKFGDSLGAQLGYNHQYNNFVMGVEGTYDVLSGLKTTSVQQLSDYSINDANGTIVTDTNALVTLRGRLGYDFNGTLVYATAGVGWLKTQDMVNLGYTYTGYGETSSYSANKWNSAFVYGGGIEQALGAHWSVRGEIMFVSAGTVSAASNGPNQYSSFNQAPVRFNEDLTIGKVGINYRF